MTRQRASASLTRKPSCRPIPRSTPTSPPFSNKPDYPSGDPWLGVNDILDGLPTYDGEAKYYRTDAGIDPAAIEWIPDDKKDLIGTAPEASYWDSHSSENKKGQPQKTETKSPPAQTPSPNTPRASGDGTGMVAIVAGAVIGIAALAAVVLTLIIGVILVLRRRRRSP